MDECVVLHSDWPCTTSRKPSAVVAVSMFKAPVVVIKEGEGGVGSGVVIISSREDEIRKRDRSTTVTTGHHHASVQADSNGLKVCTCRSIRILTSSAGTTTCSGGRRVGD